MGVIAANAFSLVYRHLVTGMSGFCRLRTPHRPGSTHAIGVSAPFTVWAVVPLLGKHCMTTSQCMTIHGVNMDLICHV